MSIYVDACDILVNVQVISALIHMISMLIHVISTLIHVISMLVHVISTLMQWDRVDFGQYFFIREPPNDYISL